MKKTRYSDEKIVWILREADKNSVAEVTKRRDVSEATIYVWCKKFGSMETDQVKRLKALEAENARLRKLLVDRESYLKLVPYYNFPHCCAFMIPCQRAVKDGSGREYDYRRAGPLGKLGIRSR